MEQINYSNFFVCPECRTNLQRINNQLKCGVCSRICKIDEGVPLLLPQGHKANKYDMDYIEHYQKDAEIFDYFEQRICKATEHDERRLREYIISLVPKNSKNILDVGSGSAWVAVSFPNKQVFSLDISLKNVKEALKQEQRKNHFGVVGDALNPPFALLSFDCIIASEIIEHIVSPGDFISNLIPLLKPGGMLIISTPYKEVIHYSQCIHCNRLTPKNAHLHSFDEKKLISLYDRKKLKDIQYYIFGNKALTVLRTHVFLKCIPFPLWKIIDRISNFILKKQAHIIALYIKKEK
jgi:2-polyprenyl-3-methyl-5-hydroxy-6-metoxy-1,4-benzoquinol methylase